MGAVTHSLLAAAGDLGGERSCGAGRLLAASAQLEQSSCPLQLRAARKHRTSCQLRRGFRAALSRALCGFSLF